MPTPRGTKLRSFPVTKPAPLPSRSRPTKPPAKVLSSRKAAALGSGGGKLTPRIREELDREPTPRRVREPREETPVRTPSCGMPGPRGAPAIANPMLERAGCGRRGRRAARTNARR